MSAGTRAEAASQTATSAQHSSSASAVDALREASSRFLFQNYKRAPVSFVRGRGARLWDAEGKQYIDFLAGIATSSLGHAHPRLIAAIEEQARRYLHVSNLYEIPEQVEAADLLLRASRLQSGVRGLDRAFFCNSGAEAVEALIKLARRWGSAKGRSRIVSMQGGFHGRTLGALAATGTPAYHEGFRPLPEGFDHVPYGDIQALSDAVTEETCAVLVEPIQGEAGVIVGGRDYLHQVQELCRRRDVLLLLDEVQTGIGRLGTMFGFQFYGLEPDAISLAKGLGGGVPVGAVLARDSLSSHLTPGTHGTTFGGNALAMAAVTAVLSTLLDDGLLERVSERSEQLRSALAELPSDLPVSEVRGEGLLLAIELEGSLPAASVAQRCLESGLLLNAVRAHTLRIVPPLVLEERDIEEGVGLLREAIERESGEATEST